MASLLRKQTIVGAGFCLAIVAAALTLPAKAQTFTVLHSFAGGADGGGPLAGVTLDGGGNLYGTTQAGGYTEGACSHGGCGTVYRLKHAGSGWTLSSLYSFHDSDGRIPIARVVFGPDGSLFGTTNEGGYQENGVVFNLRPPSTVCKSVLCPWTETVLHEFTGTPDGCLPYLGDLTFDAAGHLYGTTADCGLATGGTVFELARQPSGSWLESILYQVDGWGGRIPIEQRDF